MANISASAIVPEETAPLLGQRGPINGHAPPSASSNGILNEHLAAAPGADGRLAQTPLRLRIAAAMFSFAVLGLLASSVGVVLPAIMEYYELSHVQVSFIFPTAPIGYFVAALNADRIHQWSGQRGIAIIASLSQLVFAAVAVMHPSFPLVLAFFMIGAFGTALIDSSWCAWAGGLEKNTHMVQGLLHGSYSGGACLGPFLAGLLLRRDGARWYHWYLVIIAFLLVQLAFLLGAFWFEDANRFRESKRAHQANGEASGEASISWREMFRYRATWVCAAYFLVYVGTEAGISDWVVYFMTEARHTSPYFSSLCSSAFGAGMGIGRLFLGVVTDKIGPRRAVVCYLICAIISEALFATVTDPNASMVCISLTGFFVGPLYPSGIVTLARLIPKHLHISVVVFVATLGQVGAAVFPFGIGALVDILGVQVFQAVILAQLVATLVIWFMFPRVKELTLAEETVAERINPAVA
ncbi:MFS general substrate transporter [Thozetella sp. PMI_491]|nr:MFS general substrate transporter [Thozetella sp. PMI_491]